VLPNSHNHFHDDWYLTRRHVNEFSSSQSSFLPWKVFNILLAINGLGKKLFRRKCDFCCIYFTKIKDSKIIANGNSAWASNICFMPKVDSTFQKLFENFENIWSVHGIYWIMKWIVNQLISRTREIFTSIGHLGQVIWIWSEKFPPWNIIILVFIAF